MIPEYDALYDLKKEWYYEFLPFLSNQGIIVLAIISRIRANKFFLILCINYQTGVAWSYVITLSQNLYFS